MQIARIEIEDADGKVQLLEEIVDKDAMWKVGAAMLRNGYRVLAGKENWKTMVIRVTVEPDAVTEPEPVLAPLPDEISLPVDDKAA